jgi:hypothetical protein
LQLTAYYLAQEQLGALVLRMAENPISWLTNTMVGSLAGAGETKNFRQRLALRSSHWIDARQ